MKKTIFFVAALVMSMVAKAWEVGDFYANDPSGVPALVAYVDETGEHGLIMSPRAYTEKGYQKSLKTFEGNKNGRKKTWQKESKLRRRKRIQSW